MVEGDWGIFDPARDVTHWMPVEPPEAPYEAAPYVDTYQYHLK